MTETNQEPSPELQQTLRRMCAHNWRDYERLIPVGTNLSTKFRGSRVRLRMLATCPFRPLEDSQYCMPHSVLHGETHQNTKRFLDDSVYLYRTGQLIIPPAQDGQLRLPIWWPFRFN